jgi:hypothetical protein
VLLIRRNRRKQMAHLGWIIGAKFKKSKYLNDCALDVKKQERGWLLDAPKSRAPAGCEKVRNWIKTAVQGETSWLLRMQNLKEMFKVFHPTSSRWMSLSLRC